MVTEGSITDELDKGNTTVTALYTMYTSNILWKIIPPIATVLVVIVISLLVYRIVRQKYCFSCHRKYIQYAVSSDREVVEFDMLENRGTSPITRL